MSRLGRRRALAGRDGRLPERAAAHDPGREHARERGLQRAVGRHPPVLVEVERSRRYSLLGASPT